MKYYKNLSIDENDYSVQRQGCRIHLTTTEYQLFITLLDHSGHICSRNFLLASAWNITVPISTVTAVVCAAVALLLMNFSKNGKTVDDSRAWLKRIAITWAILNGLGFIMAYVTPFFQGGTWNP